MSNKPAETMGSPPSRPFADNAELYWAADLCVVPIEPGSKRPAKEITGWQGYASAVPSTEKRAEWLARYPDHGIGLLLGKEVMPGWVLGAIDVDDDALVRVAEAIIGQCPSSKRGKKGRTFFVLLQKDQK